MNNTEDNQPYPDGPGYQNVDTSIEAAKSTDAKKLRPLVLKCFAEHGELSPDHCADLLGLTVLSIRPRFTELKLKGLIERTGAKVMTASRKRANVFKLVNPKRKTDE
jgi:predicted ArsR family transcriptional regulator